VYFLKTTDRAQAATIFEVPLWPPGSEARLADLHLASGVGRERFTVRPVGGNSVIEDRDTGAAWVVATNGNPSRVSKDGQSIVWWEAAGERGHFDAAVTVFASRVDGGQPRELVTLWGAVVLEYLPGDREVLIAGRPVRNKEDFIMASLDVETGAMRQLAKGTWLSDALVSPGGQWVAYMVSLDRAQPDANGLWIVSTQSGAPRRLPFIGSFRWRDADRLAYIPQTLDAPQDELWELDATTLATRRLLGPDEHPFRVANADWSISPGGRHLLYRSVADSNLWLVRLP
jgi:hypothetical protein